jgi:hypothetical protein
MDSKNISLPEKPVGGGKVLYVFLSAMLLALVALAFAGSTADAVPPGTETSNCATGVDFLGFSDAFDKQSFEGTEVGGLSALTYDKRRNVYYSLVDNGPEDSSPARFYTLKAPVDRSGLGTPEILDVTILRDASGKPFTAETFDGEGITLTRNGELLISSETEPSIYRFSLDGQLLGKLPVPEKFLVTPEGEAQANRTFESLDLSPNGRSLFTAVEAPLASDGQTEDGRNRIRIVRYEDRGTGGFMPTEEFFYLTEPGQSVVEIAALSEKELLVLERSFVPGEGNTIRIYRGSLKRAEDVSDEPTLANPTLEPVNRELLVDLADCPSGGATTPGTQDNPLLDNYESLEIGPRLPGGRRSLLLQSDDNFNDVQVTRLVALGARLQPNR